MMTKQELKVLSLMAKGLNNKEIADKMCISVNTVTSYIANIYLKLGLTDLSKEKSCKRVKAVIWFLERGEE